MFVCMFVSMFVWKCGFRTTLIGQSVCKAAMSDLESDQSAGAYYNNT